jgi:hypothetical protein
MYHIMRGPLIENGNANRCEKTGYFEAGEPEKAVGISGVRGYDAD